MSCHCHTVHICIHVYTPLSFPLVTFPQYHYSRARSRLPPTTCTTHGPVLHAHTTSIFVDAAVLTATVAARLLLLLLLWLPVLLLWLTLLLLHWVLLGLLLLVLLLLVSRLVPVALTGWSPHRARRGPPCCPQLLCYALHK